MIPDFNNQWIVKRNTPFSFIIAFILFILFCCPFLQSDLDASERVENPRILILHSYHESFSWTDNVTRGIRAVFNEQLPEAELIFEFMDVKRVSTEKYLDELKKFYLKKYAGQKIDIIITSDDYALNFSLAKGRDLLPSIPIVFCGVNGYDPEKHKGYGRPVTGVVESIDIKKTLDTALNLHKNTRQVVYVTDQSVTGKALKYTAENIFADYTQSLKFTYLEHQTMEQLQKEVSALPDDTIVFAFIFSRDVLGRIWSHEYNLARMAERCSVPIYSVWEFYLGHGIVGGMLTSSVAHGEAAAGMALRILEGEKAGDIPVKLQSPNRFMFDYNQLKRFNVKSSALPPGSIIINKPVSLYQNHKKLIWTTVVFIILLLFILAFLVRDVMIRRKTEEALLENEKRFRETVEMLPEAVFETDIDYNLKFINKRAHEITGYTKDDLEAGLHGLDMIAYQDRERAMGNMKRRAQGEEIGTIEYLGLRKDGSTFPALVNINPATDKSGVVGFRGIMIDITDRKRVENQLQQSQKMEAIGTLAGGVAHDFNNILSAIIGYTELSLEDVDPESEIKENLQGVYTAGNRAKELVQRILAFARQTDEEKKPLKLVAVIKEVLQFIRSTIPSSIDIKQTIESQAIIMGNATQIHQVLLNLITNAAYAMENEGGILEVNAKDVIADSASIMTKLGLPPGEYIEIKVSDTGVGIPEEHIDSVFEPYFTTKTVDEGTGMGLAVVYGIIESHGGKITVDSMVGTGTVFTVWLPIIKQPYLQKPDISSALPKGTERILFVDDETAIVNMSSRLLERFGYFVTTRTSSVEALELFRSKPDDFDLVITDMTMPNMNGDKLAVKLMKIRPDIPVILCTGYSRKISDNTAKQIGIKSFVYKPFVKNDLSRTVRKVLDEQNKKV